MKEIVVTVILASLSMLSGFAWGAEQLKFENDNGFESVVGSRSPRRSEPVCSEGDVHIIAADEDVFRGIKFVEIDELTDTLARAVHECRRLHQEHLCSIDLRLRDHRHEFLLVLPLPCSEFFCRIVDRQIAGVVMRACVLLTWIAKADQEELGFHEMSIVMTIGYWLLAISF